MKPARGFVSLVILGVIVLVVSISILFLIILNQKKILLPKFLRTPDSSPVFLPVPGSATKKLDQGAPASETKEPAVDWKTYQGEDYSLKYPPTWVMVSPGDFRIEDKVIKIFSAHRESLAYLGNFANWCKFEPSCSGFISPVQTKIINGFEAYQYTSTDEHASKLSGTTVYFPHNGRMYKVSWGIWPKDLSNYKISDLVKELNDPTFDQILSTFRFE